MSAVEQSSGGEVFAAVEAVDVDRLPALRDASAAGLAFADRAAHVEVSDRIGAETATALLGQVVAARRHAEKQRVELTAPLNGVVKRINAAAKARIEPLAIIEQGLKDKLLAYQREQERLAELERQRLEAEAERRRQAEAARLRAVEDAARAEREAAAVEAAAAQAAEAKVREAAALRAQEETDTLTAKLRAASDAQLEALVGRGSLALQDLAAAEIAHRARLRDAEQAQLAARAREEAARVAEEEARSAPALPIVAPAVVAVVPLHGGGARVSTRKRWTYEVVDFAAVPDRFKEIAKGEVQAAVREGARDVPGLRIFEVESASVAL